MIGREIRIMLFLLALAMTPGFAQGEKVKLDGYAEYRLREFLIVEGQRVAAGSTTAFKGPSVYGFSTIPLGYEVKVTGRRRPDGVVLADKVEAKPNGIAMFEPQVLQATDQIEKIWVDKGEMFSEDSEGNRVEIGRILEKGADVERVRGIMDKLVPPYVDRKNLRVRVIETDEWNASAMGNGAIWVYGGLLKEMRDDELSIILGHELAHYTHEHSRRGARSRMFGQLAGLAAILGAQTVGGTTGDAIGLGGLLGLTAYQSGYSRDMEDQADRVGLRYAHEGGYDITAGPRLWERFREKYGESDSVSNFFVGSHSRPSDRIRNIDREIELNYGDR